MNLKWYAIMQILSTLDVFARYLIFFFIFDSLASQLSNITIFSKGYEPNE